MPGAPGTGSPTPIRIDDPSDERVADFANLRNHYREGARDYFVAEGRLVVGHLLRSGMHVRAVLVSEREWERRGMDEAVVTSDLYVAPQAVVEAICGFDFHQGVLASADRPALPGPLEVAAATDLLLLVERVNDHENLGALFRNAAGLGAGGVVLDAQTCDPLYRRSIRVSMGHVLRVPFARAGTGDWEGTIRSLQDAGFDVAALTPSDSARDLSTAARAPKQAVLVGAEGHGLSAASMDTADRCIRIPMAAGADSLNVATAAAIALYHWSGIAAPGGLTLGR